MAFLDLAILFTPPPAGVEHHDGALRRCGDKFDPVTTAQFQDRILLVIVTPDYRTGLALFGFAL